MYWNEIKKPVIYRPYLPLESSSGGSSLYYSVDNQMVASISYKIWRTLYFYMLTDLFPTQLGFHIEQELEEEFDEAN